jgi:hypothetical protein
MAMTWVRDALRTGRWRQVLAVLRRSRSRPHGERSLRLDHRERLRRGAPLRFSFEGKTLTGYEGETVASALLANGIVSYRCSNRMHLPRGVYCGMGICFECVAIIEGDLGVRTCVTYLREGMHVRRQCLDPEQHSLTHDSAD